MIEFQLEEVYDGWWNVTVGMASDGISYRVVSGDTEIRRDGSLTVLLALYARTLDRSPTPDRGGLEAFSIVETNGGIVLDSRLADEPIQTTYDELRRTLEPFLAETFARIDDFDDSKRRSEGLEFVSDELGIDANAIYSDIRKRS